jgi:hypothetical protein
MQNGDLPPLLAGMDSNAQLLSADNAFVSDIRNSCILCRT